MGLTQAKWRAKLGLIAPSWFFEIEQEQDAHLQAAAKVMEQLDADIDSHIAETFILQASGLSIDAQGDERSVLRLTGESDASYSLRVQNLKNRSNCPSLNALIDNLLIVGVAIIQEDDVGALFIDRDTYMNRGAILLIPVRYSFSIIVDKQIHAPYSFIDRDEYLNRGDYMGTIDSDSLVFQLISETAEQEKAYGTLFRIVERVG